MSPDQLMSVPLPLVSPAVCQAQSTGYTDNIICAGGAAGTGLVADTCQVRSGAYKSFLIQQRGDTWSIVPYDCQVSHRLKHVELENKRRDVLFCPSSIVS